MMSLKAENENEGVVQPSAIGIVEVIKKYGLYFFYKFVEI